MTAEPLRVGFLGLGTIASSVIELMRSQAFREIEAVGAVVRDTTKPRGDNAPLVVETVADLLSKRPDVVVEAGGHDALRSHGVAVLRGGCDLIMVSVGALAGGNLYQELADAAIAGRSHARLVSGAIGALDALASGAIGGLYRVTHVTRKPAATLLGAEAEGLREAKEIYRGMAREAVLLFPESTNVVAAVSLAGLGFDRTEVVVIADPNIAHNQHEVTAEGAFGQLRFEIRNIPSSKPATGRIVAMSVFHNLLLRRSPVVIG